MPRNLSGYFLMDYTMENTSDKMAATTLSPYLQDLSWIEPPEDRNVSLYLSLDLGRCEFFHSNCRARVTVDVGLLLPLCLAGLVGNTLAFMVLKWDSLNVAVSMQLQALAFIDNFYLLCCFFFQTLKTIADCTSWSLSLNRHFGLLEPYIWPVASIGHTSTVWMVTIITIDRYFAICRPFNHKILGTPSQVRKAVLLLLAAAILYNLPRFFEYGPEYLPSFCTQTMRYVARPTPMRSSRLYYIVYKTCCYLIFRILIPFSILIVLNTSLIRSLHTIYKEHATLTNNHGGRRNDHYTLLLVAMVTVFVACEMPDTLLRIISTFNQFTLWIDMTKTVQYAVTFTNLLLAFNSSINCIIYCLVARRFRKILTRHFCRGCTTGYATKKSFSSLNSTQIRQDTSHELLRFATCTEGGTTENAYPKCKMTDSSGKSSSDIIQHSNGSLLRNACHV